MHSEKKFARISCMVTIGIACAILCAIFTQIAGLLKHMGASQAPKVDFLQPIQTVKNLFYSKMFSLGMLVSVFAFALHAAAMGLAPLSWVQAILAAGMVMLAVFADRIFGYKVGKKQWVGVFLVAFGLALFAFTVPPTKQGHHLTLWHMIVFESVLMFVGFLAVNHHARGSHKIPSGSILGIAAGIFVGIGDIAIKAFLTGGTTGHFAWLALGALVCVAGFFTLNRGFQLGTPVSVLTSSSLASNVVCILGGWIAFKEPIPAEFIQAALHFSGFALLVVACLVIPSSKTLSPVQTA